MTNADERWNPEQEEEMSEGPGGAGTNRKPHRRAPLGRIQKVIFGIAAGLGLAVFLLYLYLFLTA